MTDAAKRAEMIERVLGWYEGHKTDSVALHDELVRVIDTAVAEAVKEREEKLRLLGYELTMLAQKNGRQVEELASLQDRLAQCQASWNSLSEGADARVAEARREERERWEKAGRMMLAAANELMAEFVSKKRAANWGVISEAMVTMDTLCRCPPASAPAGT